MYSLCPEIVVTFAFLVLKNLAFFRNVIKLEFLSMNTIHWCITSNTSVAVWIIIFQFLCFEKHNSSSFCWNSTHYETLTTEKFIWTASWIKGEGGNGTILKETCCFSATFVPQRWALLPKLGHPEGEELNGCRKFFHVFRLNKKKDVLCIAQIHANSHLKMSTIWYLRNEMS